MNKRYITIIIVVLIVILIVYLGHLYNIRSSKSKGARVVVFGSYKIKAGDKTKHNRFMTKGSNKSFYINEEEAPTLFLQRNVYYEFKNESDEPFYFTSDPDGGEDGKGSLAKNIKGFKGLANGSIFFKTTEDLPDQFYYQSGNNKNMGSVVHLV